MTPEELAENVETVIRQCMERVGPGSIGAQQYHVEGQPQKFETMDLPALLEYAKEEALDAINYSVMQVIRFDRLQTELAKRLVR